MKPRVAPRVSPASVVPKSKARGKQPSARDADDASSRAEAAHARGQTAEAISILTAFLERYPTHAPSHYMLAVYHRVSGHHELSVQHNKHALEYDANMPPAYINMGVSLVELGDRATARACYEQALNLEPNFYMFVSPGPMQPPR